LKELYYIGELAEILNISTHTLRYYDKIGILQPAYTDPVTGYRKYTYEQISYADRIRYLQNLGLKLEEIRSAIQDNDIELLKKGLEEREQQLAQEIQELLIQQEELQWYRNHYTYTEKFNISKELQIQQLPYITQREERYILVEPLGEEDGAYGIGYRLLRRKNSSAYRKLTYRRQNGYLLDYEKLLQGEFKPTHYWMRLREKPPYENKYIKRIPAGTWLCIWAKLLSESPELPGETIQKYVGPRDKAPIVIASQYETNFMDFRECPHEVQIQIE